jgi:hypothetical protein
MPADLSGAARFCGQHSRSGWPTPERGHNRIETSPEATGICGLKGYRGRRERRGERNVARRACPMRQEKLMVTVTSTVCPAVTGSGVARVVPVNVPLVVEKAPTRPLHATGLSAVRVLGVGFTPV